MANELDSNPTDSVLSTPRSDYLHDDGPQPRIRFMCSFGGKILPRPHDNQLRYVGGDTRIVAIHRHTTYSSLLSKLCGKTNVSIKYQLPNEDFDSLITVTGDEDVENMMEEYDRLVHAQKSARLRLFLFASEGSGTVSRASSINSLLDGSVKRESWFVDALNGGISSGRALDRSRSEVSVIVSEVPDYLFGSDNSEEKDGAKIRNKFLVNDNVSMSDPGSPAPVASSPFNSKSSSVAPPNVQVIPDLPPVKTRPVAQVHQENKESELVNERIVHQQTGYSGGSPMWHYPNPNVQHVPQVYYMPGSHVQACNVPIRAQYVQSYQVAQGQVPVRFPGMGQVYGAGVRQYEMPAQIYTDNSGQPTYDGGRNIAVVPGSYPGMVVSGTRIRRDVGSGFSRIVDKLLKK